MPELGLGARVELRSNGGMPRKKEVNGWFATYDNPMKDVVQKVRDIVLAADARIDECIKWQAPTFTFEGNLASFIPKSKKHASLMFHQGAKIPGQHSLLEGSGAVSRMVKLASVKEADSAKKQLAAIVRAWCDWRAQETGPGTGRANAKKRSAKKKVTKKKVTKKKAAAKNSKAKARSVAPKSRADPKAKKAKTAARKKASPKAPSKNKTKKRAVKKR